MNIISSLILGSIAAGTARIQPHIHYLTLIKGGIGVPCGSTSQRVSADPVAVTCPTCQESKEWEEAMKR